MKPVPVLFITFNRLEYSKRALESVLKTPGLPVAVTIWDNGSSDGTVEWIDRLPVGAPGVVRKVRCSTNAGLAVPMNNFFMENQQYPFVVKVDNDTVLPDNWLADLMDVMTDPDRDPKLGAVSATCLRPYGDTFASWVEKYMVTKPFLAHQLHYNSYVLGTGVLINMDLIRQRGLLFDKFPRSPESGPGETCRISGWTAYIRAAHEYEGWKFAFYSKVHADLLNIKEEHVLSNDYPDYDALLKVERDEGNRWWESVGGLDGVEKYVKEHGGLEKLPENGIEPISPEEYRISKSTAKRISATTKTNTKILTEADHLQERATSEFWRERISRHGTTASTFLATPQARINEFTERHIDVLRKILKGDERVLDVGAGWGRFSLTVSQMCGEYVGVDFMPTLIEKAKESLPRLDFRVADAHNLPFPDAWFDVVISVTTLSSLAAEFDVVLKEFHRVLRPGGRIVFLEERFARIDWKLEHE